MVDVLLAPAARKTQCLVDRGFDRGRAQLRAGSVKRIVVNVDQSFAHSASI